MSPSSPHLPWNDVLDLRSVRYVRRFLAKRWGLRMNLGLPDGSITGAEDALPARQPPSTSFCELVRELDRQQSCESDGRTLCRLHRNGHSHGEGAPREGAGLVHVCPTGLRLASAPIRIGNSLEGFVFTSAYLGPANESRQAVRDRLRQLGLADPRLGAALDAIVALSAPEESLLREVLESVAEEIAEFQTEAVPQNRPQIVSGKRQTRYCYDEIIGESRPMQELYRLLDKVIGSDSTVLIQGENGTGKELIARAIHFNSPRRERRFVVQNCSAFNDNLLDSELFGHKKGAFTGAVSDKQGLFEVADGSTFFLDEIGDMSPSLQVKLLRVLQEGTFIPVGDTQVKKVEVRIIAATNRDLKRMVERGEFREDLYYRINVIAIHAPPLRERREDIPLLINHFLEKQSRGNPERARVLAKECVARLLDYSWPGNIRELENEIERLVVLVGDDKIVSEELLSARIRQQLPRADAPGAVAPNCLPDAVENLERSMIHEVLRRNHWNKTRAAQELRISRRNLIRKVNKYKLDQRRAP